MNKKMLWGICVLVIVIIVGYFVLRSKDYSLFIQNQVPVATTTDQTSGWSTYSNTQFGFGFDYPSSWKVAVKTDTKGNAYVDLSSNTFSETEMPTVPDEEIQFSVVSPNYFNPPIGTKFGMIGYDAVHNTLVDEDDPTNCFSRPLLNSTDPNAPLVFMYDGSLMSTPAHQNYALLTQHGTIILVTELSISQSDQVNDSKIATSFHLLDGSSIVMPYCAVK